LPPDGATRSTLQLVQGARPVLTQQTRECAVSQQPATGLAAGAVVGLVLGVHDALDGRAAYGARLPLVDSDLDLVAMLRALIDLGCGGRMLCESPVMEEDALLMKAAWEHLRGP
jgi:hypothetical protein